MYRRHSDRPSVQLTAEERRRFAEIATQLRFELDGLMFDPPETRRERVATWLSKLWGRAARRSIAALGHRLAGPLLLVSGAITVALALRLEDPRWAGLAVVLPVAMTVAGATLTVLCAVRHHSFSALPRLIPGRRQQRKQGSLGKHRSLGKH